jgi:hypothetical protein
MLQVQRCGRTECNNGGIKVKVHDLKKLAPLLKRVPQTLRGIPMSEVPKVQREETRVEGRGTEVGTETNI